MAPITSLDRLYRSRRGKHLEAVETRFNHTFELVKLEEGQQNSHSYSRVEAALLLVPGKTPQRNGHGRSTGREGVSCKPLISSQKNIHTKSFISEISLSTSSMN